MLLFMSAVWCLQVVDGLAGEEGMEGVREEVPVLLDQILEGELVMLEGLPDKRIRCVESPCVRFINVFRRHWFVLFPWRTLEQCIYRTQV